MQRWSRFQKFITVCLLIFALVFFMFPVMWMLMTSFKTEAEYF